jgi:hypothetical protein
MRLIVIAAFPMAATVYSSSLTNSQERTPLRRQLRRATGLVWLGLLAFAGSVIVLGMSPCSQLAYHAVSVASHKLNKEGV